jgi:hypothetical protein
MGLEKLPVVLRLAILNYILNDKVIQYPHQASPLGGTILSLHSIYCGPYWSNIHQTHP